MKRRRKKKGNGSFNVWRSYSDMMCGLLLLFVLIMCVTLFQAQKTYDDSIKERDERESTREIAPLKQAEDAVLVDSSHMTIDEVVAAIVKLCR